MAYKGEPYCGISHVSKFFTSQSELDVAAAAEYRRRVEAYEGKAPPRATSSADFLEKMRRRAEDLRLATEAVEATHPPVVVEAGRFPPAEHRAPGDTRLRREAAARARLADRPDPPPTDIRKAGKSERFFAADPAAGPDGVMLECERDDAGRLTVRRVERVWRESKTISSSDPADQERYGRGHWPEPPILDHCFRHIPGRRARFWEAVRAFAWWLDDLAGVKLGRIVSKRGWAAMWRKPRRECP